MDCFVCNTRSAVESCSKCQALLCEECGYTCVKCGARICPDHSYRTHRGKILCLPCQEERKARRSQQDFEGKELEPGAGAGPPEEEEAAPEEEVLVASVRKPIPPWRLSLYAAGLGAVLALVLLIIPSWRSFRLPGGALFPTPYLFLVIPLAALFWSVVGFFHKEHVETRNYCWYGAVLAVVAIILMFVAIHTDPARRAEQESMRKMQERLQMDSQQLQQWRNQVLNKFR